jgi:hypothetical protein
MSIRVVAVKPSALFLGLVLFSLPAWQLSGQAITGTVVGTVRDPTGAVIQGAQITATNLATGITQSTVSGPQGNYTIPNLAPGSYKISAQSKGFATSVASNTSVQVQQTTRADFTLSPGQTTQQITVTSEAPLVQSTTSDLGAVIQSRQIEALPLNGRLFEQLVTVVPGAVQSGWGDFAENPSAAGAQSPTQAVVNGLPWSGNYYMIDGIHDTEPLNAFISITPPLDSVYSFKVETSNPNAEYGSFGGAIINLTTKSGTNNFHGEVFDFLRNDDLNARDFFAQARSPYKSNQFGGAFGGPIVKNKLFFFVDYQQLIQHEGITNVLTVPTALQRRGVLAEGGQPAIYNPGTGLAFTNNTIPPSMINPIAQKVANLFPLPNRPGLANNYIDNTVNTENAPQGDIKVDWQATERDHLFARESAAHRNLTDPSPGNVFMMGGPYGYSLSQNAVLGWDRTISPQMVNQARVGFNRYNTKDFANAYGIDENNILGIPNGNIPSLPYTSGIAQFNISGFYSTGDPGYTNAERIANIFEYTDNSTWVHGSHSITFGADVQRIQSALTNAQDDPRGIFDFNGNYTSNNGAPGTGNPFASFLLGDPYKVIRDFVNTVPAVRITYAGFFLQDDYRVTHSLTLNLGLRWDLFTSPVEKYNRQSNFDPATGLIDVASSNNRGPNVNDNHGNWAPRVGLAYSPDNGKTAIRAAFGISYFPDNFGADGGTLERNYPFFTITQLTTPTPFTPFYGLNQGLPAPIAVPYTPGGTLVPPPGFGVFFVARNFKQDEAQVWNFSIERQLPGDMGLTVAYVGTHGVHLFRDLQLNQSLPGPGDFTPRLPYYAVAPNIPTVDQRNGDGTSHYNALQVKLEKRYSSGLSLLVAYTWSKMTDDTDYILYPYADNLNNMLANGFKTADVPQTLVISYEYDLPFGPGKHFISGASGIAGHLVSGWSINGITTFESGEPFTIGVANNLLNNNSGGNLADITCPSVSMPGTVQQWFNTGCYAAPPAYTFGDAVAGAGGLYGPGIANWDFSIAKDFGGESRHLRIEGDFFNLFNTPHFSNPNNTFGNSNFGTISSDRLPPRLVQLGAKFSF